MSNPLMENTLISGLQQCQRPGAWDSPLKIKWELQVVQETLVGHPSLQSHKLLVLRAAMAPGGLQDAVQGAGDQL